MTDPIATRLRVRFLNDQLMVAWDHYVAMIREQRGGSSPRDWFESWIDAADEERAEAADRIEALEAENKRINKMHALTKDAMQGYKRMCELQATGGLEAENERLRALTEWTFIRDEEPKPHQIYRVRRGRAHFEATPC